MITSKQFIKFLQEPDLINEESVVEIEGLIKQYPYFQTAHLMYLLALNKINPKVAQEKLPIETLYVSDRYILYKDLQKQSNANTKKDKKDDKAKKVVRDVSDKKPTPLEELKKHHDEIANDMFGLNEIKNYNMVVTNVEADGSVKSPLNEPEPADAAAPPRERRFPRPEPKIEAKPKVEDKPKVEVKVETKPEPEPVKTDEKKTTGKVDILTKIAQLKKESEEAKKKRTATIVVEEKTVTTTTVTETKSSSAAPTPSEPAVKPVAAATAAAAVAATVVESVEKSEPKVEKKIEVSRTADGAKVVTEKTTVTTSETKVEKPVEAKVEKIEAPKIEKPVVEKEAKPAKPAPAPSTDAESEKPLSAAEKLKMRLNKYKSKTEEEKKNEGNSKNDLIDKFLKESPHIDRNKEVTEGDMGQESIAPPEGLYTEKLAVLYTEQKLYDKAIEIYNELILKNPEKSAYFAAKIEEINILNKK